jgi:hypothetical protein
MNYYYELNKLVKFYEGMQAFQKNAEKFLSKNDNKNNNRDNGKDNDANTELRLNLLKSYYINGNFAAIKAHIDNYEKSCNIDEFVEKFKLNLLKLNTISINNDANNALYYDFYNDNTYNMVNSSATNTANSNTRNNATTDTANNNSENMQKSIKNVNMTDTFVKKIIYEYYSVIITGNEYLSAYDKSTITKQILTYLKIFKTIDSLKDITLNKNRSCLKSNYIYKYNYTPLIFDLCKYLYEFKEYEKLTFFYNMMNFSKKIYNDFKNSCIIDVTVDYIEQYTAHRASKTFEEFDKINNKNNLESEKINVGEDNAAYNNINSKFFNILNMWESRTKNYYTKDEIFFSSAMFIANEYIPVLSEFYNCTGDDFSALTATTASSIPGSMSSEFDNRMGDFGSGLNLENHTYDDCDDIHDLHDNHRQEDSIYSKKSVKHNSCRIKNSSNKFSSRFINGNSNPIYYNYNTDYLNGNIYTNDDIAGVIKANYSNALKLFKKAIALNSYNPDYYYNYAECLKKTGKAKDAEIFYKKAFESA